MPRQRKIRIAIVAGCLIAAGLFFWLRTGPSDDLVFRDAAGTIVATARIQLPGKLPGNGQTFEGSWKLISSKPDFPSDATRSGTYRGNVNGGEISIDLNPGMADSNVVFSVSPVSDPITGKWFHATIAGGGPAMGTFTLTKR